MLRLVLDSTNHLVSRTQASKTFKIAWEPEFPRKIAFEHFEVKPTPHKSSFMQKKATLKAKYIVLADK